MNRRFSSPTGHLLLSIRRAKVRRSIAQMSDRRERFTSVGGSGPQIEIALRLQFGDPHHAAAICGDETRQQIGQPDFCDFMVLPQAASSSPALEN